MNYRHIFHAGNFADVHKHIMLVAALKYLLVKPKPIFYLDTHAGRGWYDLQSAEATRGNEWRSGIGSLIQSQPTNDLLKTYLECVREFITLGENAKVLSYPGSPLIAASLLRAVDRCVFVEREAREAEDLKAAMPRKRNSSVLCEDGYISLKAHTPPKENRGFVLIDPPYEEANEFDSVTRALSLSWQRWPTGVYALWYPITADGAAARLHRALSDCGMRKVLMLELAIRSSDSPVGLNGSGLIVVNPPWQFDQQMHAAQTELHRILVPSGDGGTRVQWLVGE